MVPAMLCCREYHETLRIEVPHNFSGSVHVECGGYGGTLQVTAVGADGHGVTPTCTSQPVDVVVERDGKAIEVDSLKWARTGDGIPVSLDFSVR
jgi:hypothetical protein